MQRSVKGTCELEAFIAMTAILALMAVSAIVGLVLGFYFSWIAISISGLVVGIVSAAVLQNEGFGFLAGIATIVVCLSVNQFTYLIGVTGRPQGQ